MIRSGASFAGRLVFTPLIMEVLTMKFIELLRALRLCSFYNDFKKNMDRMDTEVDKKNAKSAYGTARRLSGSVTKIIRTIR